MLKPAQQSSTACRWSKRGETLSRFFVSRRMRSILHCSCVFAALVGTSLQTLFPCLLFEIIGHKVCFKTPDCSSFACRYWGTLNKLKEGLKALNLEQPLRLKQRDALWEMDSAIHSFIPLITEYRHFHFVNKVKFASALGVNFYWWNSILLVFSGFFLLLLCGSCPEQQSTHLQGFRCTYPTSTSFSLVIEQEQTKKKYQIFSL